MSRREEVQNEKLRDIPWKIIEKRDNKVRQKNKKQWWYKKGKHNKETRKQTHKVRALKKVKKAAKVRKL